MGSKIARETSCKSNDRNPLKRSRSLSPVHNVRHDEKAKRRKSDDHEGRRIEDPESSASPTKSPSATRPRNDNEEHPSTRCEPTRGYVVPSRSDTSSDDAEEETVIPNGAERTSSKSFEHATTNAVTRPRLPDQHSALLVKEIKPGLRFVHGGAGDGGNYTTGRAQLVWGKVEGSHLGACLPITLDIAAKTRDIIQTQRFLKRTKKYIQEFETKKEKLDNDLRTWQRETVELESVYERKGLSAVESALERLKEMMASAKREKTIVNAQKDALQKRLNEWQLHLSSVQQAYNAIMESVFIEAALLDTEENEEEDAQNEQNERLQRLQQQAQDPARAERTQTALELHALRQNLEVAQMEFWQRKSTFSQREAEHIQNNFDRPIRQVYEEFSLLDLQSSMKATGHIVQLENCLRQAQARALDAGISFDDVLGPFTSQENDGKIILHSDDYVWNEDQVKWCIERCDRRLIEAWRRDLNQDYYEPMDLEREIPDDIRVCYERPADIQVGGCWEDLSFYDNHDPMRLTVEIWTENMDREREAVRFNMPGLQVSHQDGDF